MQLLQPGTMVFNRYRVSRFIAAGGQAFGFAGLDTNAPPSRPWERDVFLKQYHDLVLSEEALQALRTRLTTLRKRLAANDHFICLPTEVGSQRNSVLMVFPQVKGKTLREWMDEGLSQEQCVRFAQALTKAVRIIHEAGVIHLDLKPDNVIIESKHRNNETTYYLQLIDLDAARIDGVGLQQNPMGTPMYYSPEHFAPEKSKTVSEKSDVFTLAIMVFELLFKVHPFAEADDYHEAVLNKDFQIPQSRYYKNIVRMLVRCLSPNPKNRPRAAELHSTMHRYYLDGFETDDTTKHWKSSPSYNSNSSKPKRRKKTGNRSAPKAKPVLAGQSVRSKRSSDLVEPSQPSVVFKLSGGRQVRFSKSGTIRGEQLHLPLTFHGPVAELEIHPAECHLAWRKSERNPLASSNKGLFASLFRWWDSKPTSRPNLSTITLNGRELKISERTRIENGDQLRVGSYEFGVHIVKGTLVSS